MWDLKVVNDMDKRQTRIKNWLSIKILVVYTKQELNYRQIKKKLCLQDYFFYHMNAD